MILDHPRGHEADTKLCKKKKVLISTRRENSVTRCRVSYTTLMMEKFCFLEVKTKVSDVKHEFCFFKQVNKNSDLRGLNAN